MNLNSLKHESVERLEEAGFLSGLADEEVGKPHSGSNQATHITRMGEGREVQGVPWFEEMVEGSELGRVRRRGGGRSSDGKTIVEYEITEFESGDGDTTTGKRKHGSLGDGDDVEMRSS